METPSNRPSPANNYAGEGAPHLEDLSPYQKSLEPDGTLLYEIETMHSNLLKTIQALEKVRKQVEENTKTGRRLNFDDANAGADGKARKKTQTQKRKKKRYNKRKHSTTLKKN